MKKAIDRLEKMCKSRAVTPSIMNRNERLVMSFLCSEIDKINARLDRIERGAECRTKKQ